MVTISTEKLTKIFDNRVRAVDNVTITFESGKISSLLGPSGCGKTTLLRCIAGLESPTSGRVFFNDKDVTDIPPKERNVAMMFQFPAIYPMSVFDNIAFPLEIKHYPRQEITRRVKEIAEKVGILKILDVKDLSMLDVGTKQKIVLARTFIRDADIYLLDEPLTNVDPVTRLELRTLIKDLSRKSGKTVIYVTHDQTEALSLADKIAVMNQGKILQVDTPDKLYLYPRHTFVGWFIGNPGMNFINCYLERTRKMVTVKRGDLILYAARVSGEVSLEEKEIILGIRPEHIDISLSKPSANNWIKVRCINKVRFSSKLVLIYVDLAGQEVVIKTRDHPALTEGKEVWINLKEEYLRFYNKSGVLTPLIKNTMDR